MVSTWNLHAPLIIFLLQRFHVLSDVTTVDVLLQNLSVQLLRFDVVSRETLGVVGDEDTTVGSTLEGTEDTGTSRCPLETDIEEALERPGSILLVKNLSENKRTIWLSNTLVLVGKTKLGQSTTRTQETSRVC